MRALGARVYFGNRKSADFSATNFNKPRHFYDNMAPYFKRLF